MQQLLMSQLLEDGECDFRHDGTPQCIDNKAKNIL